MNETLVKMADGYLKKLCVEIPGRHLGGAGNRKATDFFRGVLAACGFAVETDRLECIDWQDGGSRVSCGRRTFPVHTGPYSAGCDLELPLVAVRSAAELEKAEIKNRVALLYGDITREQLMPKSFPFYNPEEHQRIIRLLEQKQPAALIAAATKNQESAGGLYPFPLIEDGDFHIPSVYTTAEQGAALLSCSGEPVKIAIDSRRNPSDGFNVSGIKGDDHRHRIVFCAHIDSKWGSPGALDNAGGVVILMLLAELLKAYKEGPQVEIATLNGHEYYSIPGALRYLEKEGSTLKQIMLAVNLDGVGYEDSPTAYSFYECPEQLRLSVQQAFMDFPGLVQGDAWPQSDHMVFAMNGRPAVALTSDFFLRHGNTITHSPEDKPGIVNLRTLVNTAVALHGLFKKLP
jgi:aminopeptidase YwaD